MIILRLVVTVAEDPMVLDKAVSALQPTTEGKRSLQETGPDEMLGQLHAVGYWRPTEKIGNSGGPRKRLRLMVLPHKHDTHNVEVHPLVSELYHLLGNEEVDDLTGLSTVAGDGFDKLSESQRCTIVKDLGLLSCALAGSLVEVPVVGPKWGWGPYKCSYCDAESVKSSSIVRPCANDRNVELFKTLEVFLKLDNFQRSVEVRVWAMMSLKRMLNHTRDLVHLSLAQSSLGKWCINALQSSKREIRIAAGYVNFKMAMAWEAKLTKYYPTRRTLPSFVGFDHDGNILKDNRVMIIEFLRNIPDGDDPPLQETCVLAWSQLGRYIHTLLDWYFMLLTHQKGIIWR